MKRLFVGLTAALLMVLSVSGAALAAPANAPNARFFVVTCGGDPFNAVTNGNGAWAVGHAIDSTAVLIPVGFGDTNVWIDGVQLPTEPGSSKGSAAPQGHPLIWCTYTGDDTFDGHTVHVEGTVQGFILR